MLKPKGSPRTLKDQVFDDSKEVKKQKINPLEVMKRRRALQEGETLVDKLTDDLEQVGVVMFKPKEMGGHLNIDADYLTMPKDITETPSQYLGQYLNAFTQQRMYLRTLIGWQAILMEEAKREYYNVSEVKYRELSKSKLSETAKERELNSDLVIKPVFLEYKDCKRKLELLELNLASIEDAIFQISREISRRGADFETENRNHNVSRR